ncbi:hypothetical protein WHY64_15795 (plasmid) [Clostridium perfringens]|uniref:Metallohydrolase n=3 Tax=Clostridium perfringens TaxID=1502 RepID=B6F185_CLOPF|nr:hypothetical protein [Clostridium perfringens]MDU7016686.1 hypothetical protein [Enterobacter sp.]EDT23225.1 conserved hypothetical protein [Clostridium perfringens B str. ATCC 3626]EGT3607772.1 hypothetical protein [Clostridium perfringens]EGT3620141.1 hypothetical protein [Clostridium perfringens]EHA1006774.1 hypothetical protein [Clostridium perfringens]
MLKLESNNKITFFPVGNGDTTLISLKDNTNILMDCNITKDSGDENVIERYDVIGYLLEKLPRDKSNIPHLDVFILSHPDIDHCRSIDKHFYLGNPSEYDNESDKDKIIIDELWFAPGIFEEDEEDLNENAKAFKKEANRRKKLYENNDLEKSIIGGNRLRMIGSTDNEELENIKNITTSAGEYLNLINGKIQEEVSFFILGPVKAENDDSEVERNQRSIILKIEFKINSKDVNNVVILAGDSRIENWKRIMKKNDLKNLKFDIFMAPHHCSWYFFSSEDYKLDPPPKADEDIISFIENGKEDENVRVIIASCKEIKRNEDNPPHYRAANNYKKAVGDSNFYCLSEYPSVDEPKPLTFIFTKFGPIKSEIEEVSEINSTKALIKTASTPKTYGK